MTQGMLVGQRVKATGHAFANGVFRKTEANRRMRGTIVRICRDPWTVAVLWDGKKTVQRYWHSFISRANY